MRYFMLNLQMRKVRLTKVKYPGPDQTEKMAARAGTVFLTTTLNDTLLRMKAL